jgi:capsular exopolysaccharide synthesis family protein
VLDVFSVLAALNRHRFIILAGTILGTLVAVYLGMRSVPKYTATAQVLVERTNKQVINLDAEDAVDAPVDDEAIDTEIQILNSRSLIEDIILDLDLAYEPGFRPQGGETETASSSWSMKGIIGDALALLPGGAGEGDERLGDSSPSVGVSSSANPSLNSLVKTFKDNLDVYREGDAYILAVSYTALRPETAATISNRLVELYADRQRGDKLEETSQASGWLAERVSALREELREAEREVENFRAGNNLLVAGLDTQNQELIGLSTELVTVRANLSAKEATLTLVRSRDDQPNGYYDIAEVTASPIFQALKTEETAATRLLTELANTYGPNHPLIIDAEADRENVRAKIDGEVQRVIQAIENDVRLLRERERVIKNEMDGIRSNSASQNQAEVQLRDLERDAESIRELYQEFLRRLRETREQPALVRDNVKIISREIAPAGPSTPGPKLIGLIGFCASFAVSSMLALLLDRMDNKLRSADQLRDRLGVNTIAAVPRLDRLRRNKLPHHQLIDKPMSAYAEAIRSIYMAVKSSPPRGEPKIALVTSTLPGEGKTTLTLSLATLAAQSNQRTLVVDLDLRRPSIYPALGMEPSAVILEHIESEADILDGVRVDSSTRLDVVQISTQLANPADVIESPTFQNALNALRDRYTVIVIDSAPLFAVVEARTLAAFADVTIFAVRWGHTDEKTVAGGLDLLAEADANLSGAVLTQVEMKRHAQYGYGDSLQHHDSLKKYYID